MNHKIIFFAVAYIFLVATFVPQTHVSAEESFSVGTVMTTATFRFNNENWFTAEHPKVAQFAILDNGDARGITETGVTFVQYTIPNDLGIRVQRFEIQDHYHYIVDGREAYTSNQLSRELARAYSERISA